MKQMTKFEILRRQKGLTQQGLAQMIGTSQAHISQLENGTCVPRTSTAIKLAEVFEISLDELLK